MNIREKLFLRAPLKIAVFGFSTLKIKLFSVSLGLCGEYLDILLKEYHQNKRIFYAFRSLH